MLDIKTDPNLLALLEQAARRPMTPEERRRQRESWVIAEAWFGSDADEAAYRAALEAGDKDALAKLDAESDARMRRAAGILGREG